MRRPLLIVAAPLVLAALAVSGCVIQVDRYPDTWDRLNTDAKSDGCPSLNGVYENKGIKPDGTKTFLATWLSNATGRDRQEGGNNARNLLTRELLKASTVEILVTDGAELTIHAKGDGISVLWTISKGKGQFECKGDVLVIQSGGDESGDNVAAFSSGSMKLYSGREHLIVNSNVTTAGVMLLVPVAGHSDTWGRFAREQTK